VENRGILEAETATAYRVSCGKIKGKQQHPLLPVVKKTKLESVCSYTMNIVRAAFPRAGN